MQIDQEMASLIYFASSHLWKSEVMGLSIYEFKHKGIKITTFQLPN